MPVPTSTLQQELKQSRPFASPAEEAQLGVLRTAEVLARAAAELLRPYGLTPTQYNVLRILRGAGPEGLPCSEIGARMVTHEPDVTRLLDRLHRAGHVSRERAESDRRVVLTRITPEGLALLARLDGPVAEADARRGGVLTPDELRTLIGLLDRLRAAAGEAARSAPAADTR
jgi:DNA-binding MarR family transcriptional regulator